MAEAILHPQLLIAGAGHHWDSSSYGALNLSAEPQFIRNAHLWEIRIVEDWLKECEYWFCSYVGGERELT